MTPQQRRLSDYTASRLATYKTLIVGDAGWGYLAGFEVYNLLLSALPSIVGIGLRSMFLPLFLKSAGKGVVVGRGVTIKLPNYISLGNGVLIDDYACIAVRLSPEGPS